MSDAEQQQLARDLEHATDEQLSVWSRAQERDQETARLTYGSDSAQYHAEAQRSDIYAAARCARGWSW